MIQIFSAEKIKKNIEKIFIFILCLLKLLIVDTHQNHLAEVVLKSTLNLCFEGLRGFILHGHVFLMDVEHQILCCDTKPLGLSHSSLRFQLQFTMLPNLL